MDKTKAILMHEKWQGKIEITPKADVTDEEILGLAYTPGVADACLAIKEDPSLSFTLTGRKNMVAIITDGSAILGLGNIGPKAGMPVMEGKSVLFKTFGNVDAIPLCLNTQDPEEIIKIVKSLEPNFNGINLEDISAPRCFEIETRLINELQIPVFHDDQHGTAIVVGAALINALKIVKKDIKQIKVVINGAGAAGTAIGKFLLRLGVSNLIMVDKNGIIWEGDPSLNNAHQELATLTNHHHIKGTLKDALINADLFIGVSVGNIVTKEMIATMNKNAIVFALANPIPEISRADALEAGAFIVGNGSNKFPNQINNVLVFPGLFRGAIDAEAKKITTEMMIAAAYAIANTVKPEELNVNYIIPKAVNREAHLNVSKAVYQAAKNQ